MSSSPPPQFSSITAPLYKMSKEEKISKNDKNNLFFENCLLYLHVEINN